MNFNTSTDLEQGGASIAKLRAMLYEILDTMGHKINSFNLIPGIMNYILRLEDKIMRLRTTTSFYCNLQYK